MENALSLLDLVEIDASLALGHASATSVDSKDRRESLTAMLQKRPARKTADMDANTEGRTEKILVEDKIEKLIVSAKANIISAGELIDEVEKHGKLKMLLQFLEARVAEGSTDVQVHSSLAKVYVESNMDPAADFLVTSGYYDSRAVGSFCEKHDPYLAFVAYERGNCDEEIIEVTNKHQLFKDQARYLVDRGSPELCEEFCRSQTRIVLWLWNRLSLQLFRRPVNQTRFLVL